MANIVYNQQYVTQGINRLLTQFRDKPRVIALLTSFLNEVQALEDAWYTFYIDRLIQNGLATGNLLALLGKLVGQGSEGLSDAQFLLLIQARILANRSDGLRENLISILSILVPGVAVYAKQFPPMAIYIAPQGPLTLPPYLVGDSFLKPAVAGGEQLAFVWTPQPIANTWIGGSIHAPSFAAGPPVTNAGVTSAQSPGSIYNAGFAAGPPVSGDGGGVGAGVIQIGDET